MPPLNCWFVKNYFLKFTFLSNALFKLTKPSCLLDLKLFITLTWIARSKCLTYIFSLLFYIKMGHPRPLSWFPSFQYTVDSKQMFNINKFLLMTWFKPQTSGIGSNCSTNWATTTAHKDHFYRLQGNRRPSAWPISAAAELRFRSGGQQIRDRHLRMLEIRLGPRRCWADDVWKSDT